MTAPEPLRGSTTTTRGARLLDNEEVEALLAEREEESDEDAEDETSTQ